MYRTTIGILYIIKHKILPVVSVALHASVCTVIVFMWMKFFPNFGKSYDHILKS